MTKRFGGRRSTVDALAGVDLEIDEGEFLAIQGATGSGKSTLLQMLGAMDRPTGGRLLFEGRDLAGLGERDLADLRSHAFGFVFQAFNLIPTLTAQENVETALVPWHTAGRARRRPRRPWPRSASPTAPTTCPSSSPAASSNAWPSRGRWCGAPRVILADEPTGNLDERTRDEIVGLLEDLWRERGQTLIVVTHDSWVAGRASRRLWLDAGRLAEGAPAAARPPLGLRPALPGTAALGAAAAS